MISFSEAFGLVMDHVISYGSETVNIKDAHGRVLAEDVYTDRDYPPFNRATKDGIVIKYEAFEEGRRSFEIKGIIAAGTEITQLMDRENCFEIMTGAVIPYDTDTVIMYEEIAIEHGIAKLKKDPVKGQNIHLRGSDRSKKSMVLKAGSRLSAAEIGVLATVGKDAVSVRKLPAVSVISTGNELVDVDQEPLPHQIRRSNTYSLNAALADERIAPLLLHLKDDPDIIRQKLHFAIDEMDVLLLSGGVSKGKFDFIPQVMEELGVEKIFHGVLQKPGKPFWFGVHPISGTRIFSFPGNPVSTFVNYHVYFRNWLRKSMDLPIQQFRVFLSEQILQQGTLTRFIRVSLTWEGGRLMARPVTANGSGDLMSLADTDGFIALEPRPEAYKPLEPVPFVPTRSLM